MTSKRVLGFVFILIAVLLTLGIVGQLPDLFGVILGFFMIFTGKLDRVQIGEIIGQTIFWIFYFVITIALWNYGIKWSKKQVKHKQ